MRKTLLLLFIFSTLHFAQWSTTISEDTEYTNRGDVVSAIDDKNGGTFLIHGLREFSIENTFIPIFVHINKYGYEITGGVVIETLHDYSTVVQIHPSSDNNLFVSFLDNIIIKYWNGLAVYAGKTAVIKIDTNGIPLWDEPIYAIIDSLNHNTYELIPDDSGGCFISTSANYIETNASYGQKSIQHISSSGERLWGEEGIMIYEGFQANGLQFFPPKIHPRSDNNLFVYVVTNLSSAFEIHLFSYDGEQLLNTKYTPDRRFFNTFLTTDDELLVLTYDNTGGFSAHNLILGTCIAENDTITFVDSTLLQQVNSSIYHTHSTIDKKNNIHLLWRIDDDNEGLLSYYKKITNEFNGLFDSIGVKLPATAYTFLLENDTTTFLLETESLYRIDNLAQPIWGDEGLLFTLDDCLGPDAQVVSDNDNGIIVLWNECISGVRAKLINKNGEIGIVTNVDESNIDYLSNFVVSSNYPNPFNPTTTINYSSNSNFEVKIEITNLLGEQIYIENKSYKNAGNYFFHFDGTYLSSGVYFCTFYLYDIRNKLEKVITNKLTLIK